MAFAPLEAKHCNTLVRIAQLTEKSVDDEDDWRFEHGFGMQKKKFILHRNEASMILDSLGKWLRFRGKY